MINIYFNFFPLSALNFSRCAVFLVKKHCQFCKPIITSGYMRHFEAFLLRGIPHFLPIDGSLGSDSILSIAGPLGTVLEIWKGHGWRISREQEHRTL